MQPVHISSRRVILEKLAKSSSEKDLKEALKLQTITLSPLEPGKVRVKILFASLNYADVLVVQGKYQEKPRLPTTLGSECCGTVVEIHNDLCKGSSLVNLKGQTVIVVCTTNTKAGAYADFIDVYPWQIFPIPRPEMQPEIAAGFAVAAGTAHIALTDRANVKSGELVVVTGASGGTGMYACLIAKALKCRVVATARGKEKVKFVKTLLGTEDVVIDIENGQKNKGIERQSNPYGELVQAVFKINKMGAQVIYDTVGGSLFKTLLKCAKWKCRLCVVGFASGGIPKVPSNILLVKNSSVVGVYWGNYFKNERETIQKSLFTLFKMIQDRNLKLDAIPINDFKWDLDDLPSALAALSSGKTYGKVLVSCSQNEVRKALKSKL